MKYKVKKILALTLAMLMVFNVGTISIATADAFGFDVQGQGYAGGIFKTVTPSALGIARLGAMEFACCNAPNAREHSDPAIEDMPTWVLCMCGTITIGNSTANINGSTLNTNVFLPRREHITRIYFSEYLTAGASLGNLFRNLTYLLEIGGLHRIDTSAVTTMSFMFHNASSLRTVDLSMWDTRNLISAAGMFWGATSLQHLNLAGFVQARQGGGAMMLSMFLRNTHSLTHLDISGWDTRNVTIMDSFFENAQSLTHLDLSSWDVSRVANFSHMFSGASSLVTLDLSGWNTSNATNMWRMFSGTSNLVSLDLSGWNTRNVTRMDFMFDNAISLTTLNLDGWSTNGIPGASGMSQMFRRTLSLRELTLGRDFILLGGVGLPTVPNNDYFTGRWQNVGGGTPEDPQGNSIFTSVQFNATISRTLAGETWVWQPRIFECPPAELYPIHIIGHGLDFNPAEFSNMDFPYTWFGQINSGLLDFADLNLTGQVMIVNRGNVGYSEMLQVAQSTNAAALLIANNEFGYSPVWTDIEIDGIRPETTIPIFSVGRSTAETYFGQFIDYVPNQPVTGTLNLREVRWIQVLVNFDAGGGTVYPSRELSHNGRLSSLPTPQRDGYIFQGWFSEQEEGYVITAEHVFTSNTSIFARWARDYDFVWEFNIETLDELLDILTTTPETWSFIVRVVQDVTMYIPRGFVISIPTQAALEISSGATVRFYGNLINYGVTHNHGTVYTVPYSITNNGTWEGNPWEYFCPCEDGCLLCDPTAYGFIINGVLVYHFDEVEGEIGLLLYRGQDVTVTGRWHNIPESLWIEIPYGRTITWAAEISRDAERGRVLEVFGDGTFVLAEGGVVSVTGGRSRAIDTDYDVNANIVVDGGIVSALGNLATAIRIYNGTVTVSGGSIYAVGTQSRAIDASSADEGFILGAEFVTITDGLISAIGANSYAVIMSRGIFTHDGGEIIGAISVYTPVMPHWFCLTTLAVYDGTTEFAYYCGDEKRIEISSSGALALFASQLYFDCCRFEGYNVYLTANIDLSAALWLPADMCGVRFVGDGYIISGLVVRDTVFSWTGYEAAGLFGMVYNCVIEGISFANPIISIETDFNCDYALGVVAGVAFRSLIIGVEVLGGEIISIKTDDYYDEPFTALHIGGIVGASYGSEIHSTAVYGTLVSLDICGLSEIRQINMGGITGSIPVEYTLPYGSRILNSVSTASFEINGSYVYDGVNVGGIAGRVNNGSVINTVFISPQYYFEILGEFTNNSSNRNVSHNHRFINGNEAYLAEVVSWLNCEDETAQEPWGGFRAAVEESAAYRGLNYGIARLPFLEWEFRDIDGTQTPSFRQAIMRNIYTVTFNANSGVFIGIPPVLNVVSGTEAGMLPGMPQIYRERHRFTGWVEYVDGEFVRRSHNFIVTANTVLYATWEETPENFRVGSTTGNGRVTTADASRIARWLTGQNVEDFCKLAADINGDGEITVQDLTLLVSWLAGHKSVAI